MVEEVLGSIREYSMINPGEKIIVGVSGGPDSMCLINILLELKPTLFFELVVAHINHGLRGIESDKDESFVEDFCKKNGIEFHSIKIDLIEISKEEGASLETAGRKARYDFFQKLQLEIKANKVALAHNANDQAETVLMRIIRGSGLEGLGGIKPIRDGIFIRPLINISREKIESYLNKNSINFRIDKSNLDSAYTRNRIRHELLPLLSERFNPQIVNSLCNLAELLRTDNQYINNVAEEKYNSYCDKKKSKVIIYREAFLEDKAIIVRIIRIALTALVGSTANFERIHIESIIDIQKPPTGRKVMLKEGVYALNSYGNIFLIQERNKDEEDQNTEHQLHLGYNPSAKMSLSLLPYEEDISLKCSNLIQYFDYDKVKGVITLRYRKNGDSFVPLGMKGNKKLKDLFMDLKISKDERSRIPIICFNKDIGWVVGIRTGEKYKIDKNTKNILEIKLEGEE